MNYKEKTFHDSSYQEIIFNDENTSFKEILKQIKSGTSVQKTLQILKKKTISESFQYQYDFSSSGFGQFLINSLVPNNNYLIDYLDIVKNLTSQKTNQYSIKMCELGLVSTLDALINSLDEKKIDNAFYHKFINIILILASISSINMDIKNSIVDSNSLEKILDISINYTKRADIDKLIYFLFAYLLDLKENESSEAVYLAKFEKFFTFFDELYIKKDEPCIDVISILKFFLVLTRIPSFIHHFDDEVQEKSKINGIMQMIEYNDDEILEVILVFHYQIIQYDFRKVTNYVDRYLDILEKYSSNFYKYNKIPDVYKHKIEILHYDALIIEFVMDRMPDYINNEKYYSIALDLMKITKDSIVSYKIIFVNCLFTLFKRCDNDCFFKLVKNDSFGLFLTDFIDVEDDDFLSSVINEINYLADKEMEINETYNVLYEFLDNGGSDFFKEYLSNCENQEIVNLISATIKKYQITL